MQNPSATTTLVCHARTPLVLDPIEERVERAQACVNEPLVDDVVVRSWPDTVRLDDAGPHREVIEEYDRFKKWAASHGVTIRPPFETRTRSSIVEDDEIDVLVTPVLCLALYRNERLVGVYPHSSDEDTYQVERALTQLESGRRPQSLPSARKVSRDTQWCPECETPLVNGQGVFVCPECAWSGMLSTDEWSPLEPGEQDAYGEHLSTQ